MKRPKFFVLSAVLVCWTQPKPWCCWRCQYVVTQPKSWCTWWCHNPSPGVLGGVAAQRQRKVSPEAFVAPAMHQLKHAVTTSVDIQNALCIQSRIYDQSFVSSEAENSASYHVNQPLTSCFYSAWPALGDGGEPEGLRDRPQS